jgi:hypothetical protein
MVNIGFHTLVFICIVTHMLSPIVENECIVILDTLASHYSGLFGWWITYWWVIFRDGIMIISAIIAIIALKYALVWKIELSDSTLYIPIDEPWFTAFLQTSSPVRRWRRRRFRKFRCVLHRSVVFRIIHNRRRHFNRDRRHHRRP